LALAKRNSLDRGETRGLTLSHTLQVSTSGGGLEGAGTKLGQGEYKKKSPILAKRGVVLRGGGLQLVTESIITRNENPLEERENFEKYLLRHAEREARIVLKGGICPTSPKETQAISDRGFKPEGWGDFIGGLSA